MDLNSKIEGASPHRLVSILYEELALALSRLQLALRRGASPRQHEAQARALGIVLTRRGGLDFEKGGEIATALASVYAEAARLIGQGGRVKDPAPIAQAQAMLAEIAEAWNAIV